MLASNSSPSISELDKDNQKTFEPTYINCSLCLKKEKVELIYVDPNTEKILFKRKGKDNLRFKVFHQSSNGRDHSVILDYILNNDVYAFKRIISFQEEGSHPKTILSKTVHLKEKHEIEKKILENSLKHEFELQSKENLIKELQQKYEKVLQEREYDSVQFSKLLQDKDQNIKELNKSFIEKLQKQKDELAKEQQGEQLKVFRDANIKELSTIIEEKSNQYNELSSKYTYLKLELEKKSENNTQLITKETKTNLTEVKESENGLSVNSELVIQTLNSLLMEYSNVKIEIFDIIESSQGIPTQFQDSIQFLYSDLFLHTEKVISTLLQYEFKLNDMGDINKQINEFKDLKKHTKEVQQSIYDLNALLYTYTKLISPVKIFIRQLLAIFIENTNHIIIPNDASLVGPVKTSWTRTRLSLTIKKNTLRKDLFNILDSDTVRVLIRKHGLLSSEKYLLIVPSSFDARQSDWEEIDNRIKIMEKNIKISVKIPEIISRGENEFSLGVFKNKSFFVIVQK